MTLDNAIEDADSDYRRTIATLRRQALSVRDRAAEVVAAIDRGEAQHVNSLGALQYAGVELDRLCGVAEAQRAWLKRLQRLAATEPTP